MNGTSSVSGRGSHMCERGCAPSPSRTGLRPTGARSPSQGTVLRDPPPFQQAHGAKILGGDACWCLRCLVQVQLSVILTQTIAATQSLLKWHTFPDSQPRAMRFGPRHPHSLTHDRCWQLSQGREPPDVPRRAVPGNLQRVRRPRQRNRRNQTGANNLRRFQNFPLLASLPACCASRFPSVKRHGEFAPSDGDLALELLVS